MKAQTRSGGEGQAWMRIGIGIGIGASSPPCSIGGARRSTATPADRVVQRRSLADALAALSEGDREVLMLVGWEELDPKQAAEAAGYRSQARWDLYPMEDALATRAQLQLSELWRDAYGGRFQTTATGPTITPGAVVQVPVDALPQMPPQQQALRLPTLHPDGPLLRPGGVEDAVAAVLTDGEEPFKSFFGALDIIQERVLPGDQLAEMYRLLARTDGIRYRGEVVDRAGRDGLAFTITRDDPAEDPLATFELLLIVDPTDGRPLQVEVVIDHNTVRDITTPRSSGSPSSSTSARSPDPPTAPPDTAGELAELRAARTGLSTRLSRRAIY